MKTYREMIVEIPMSNKKLIVRRCCGFLDTWEYSYDDGDFIKFDDPHYLCWKFGACLTQEQLDSLEKI